MKSKHVLWAAGFAAFIASIEPASGASAPGVDANSNPRPESEVAAGSEDQAGDLAKKLQNPVASLISVPFQSNFDFNLGPNDDGFRYTMNF